MKWLNSLKITSIKRNYVGNGCQVPSQHSCEGTKETHEHLGVGSCFPGEIQAGDI
jgi:hypothetical protein